MTGSSCRWTEAIDRQADRFHHVRKLEDAEHLNGGAPNNDTLYSRAWVHLQDEPVILSVPEISDRYYTMEIVDFMGDNFAYVGTRATGTKAGNYAIIGPDWKGSLPDGVVALPPSATPWATILGRTFVKNAGELDVVHAIQDQYKLTPLSQWGRSVTKPPKNAVIWEAFDPKTDPLANWKTINRAMIEVPPPVRDADLLQSYARSESVQGSMSKRSIPARNAGSPVPPWMGASLSQGPLPGVICKRRSMAGTILPRLRVGRPLPEIGCSAPSRCSRALSPTIP